MKHVFKEHFEVLNRNKQKVFETLEDFLETRCCSYKQRSTM